MSTKDMPEKSTDVDGPDGLLRHRRPAHSSRFEESRGSDAPDGMTGRERACWDEENAYYNNSRFL